MEKSFAAGKHLIGFGAPCFVIAEAGVNHNGDLSLAKNLVDVAIDAGADAVKFQTFRAENLVNSSAPMAEYQSRNIGHESSQFEMLKKLELDEDSHDQLVSYCNSKNITFLSTPFSESSADFLTKYKLPLMKIPSGEITNTPFLRYLAKMGRPLILSTGMSTLQEVERAVEVIREAGSTDYCLLHCTSNYPASFESVNLRAMQTLSDSFGCPVGYSDHTLGIEVAIAAAALGACVIEKHFTYDRNLEGPDHKASLEPKELKAMISGIRNIERAMGDGIKKPSKDELATAGVARKSIVAAKDILAERIIDDSDVRMLRPGTGLNADALPEVIGKRAGRFIQKGEVLSWEMLT